MMSGHEGTPYYEMIFIYTDNLLVVSHKQMETLTMLDHHYHLKSDSIGTPKTYLGSQVKCFNLNDDPTQQCWALSSEKYIQDAVHNLNRNMSKSKGWTLQSSLLTLWMDENSSQQSNKNCWPG